MKFPSLKGKLIQLFLPENFSARPTCCTAQAKLGTNIGKKTLKSHSKCAKWIASGTHCAANCHHISVLCDELLDRNRAHAHKQTSLPPERVPRVT